MRNIFVILAMAIGFMFTFNSNANAAVMCIGIGSEVHCIYSDNVDDLHRNIMNLHIPAGEYDVLIEKECAEELRERFRDEKRVKDVSLKIFTATDRALKERFQSLGGKSYYSLKVELGQE